MKKLVLSIIAIMAVATSSFAQYGSITSRDIDNFLSSYGSSGVSYSVPSVNYNTTTVSGYSRSNGTYVQSHVRTMPNDTNWDNYSTIGNINPYTGSKGHRAKDYSSGALNYGAGHTIHTGSRGGQYYRNSNGNKVYVPKRNLW